MCIRVVPFAIRITRSVEASLVEIRLLGLEKFLSPKAPPHILWLKCAAYLSLINPLEAAQLWGKVRPQAC